MRDTQVTAISLLAMIETPASSAAPRLIELLLRSQNEDIRILAVGALPKVASSENLKSIIAVLGSTLKDKNQDVRFGSALSLAQLYENGNKTFISSGNTDAFKKIIRVLALKKSSFMPRKRRGFSRPENHLLS